MYRFSNPVSFGARFDADRRPDLLHPYVSEHPRPTPDNKSLNAMLGAQSEFAMSGELASTMDVVTGRLWTPRLL